MEYNNNDSGEYNYITLPSVHYTIIIVCNRYKIV